jgi:hypothetical protein
MTAIARQAGLHPKKTKALSPLVILNQSGILLVIDDRRKGVAPKTNHAKVAA